MKLRSYPTLLSLALVSSLLVACGGGDDAPVAVVPPTQGPVDPPVPGTGVPTSATTSAAGATNFVKSVVATPGDSEEPIALGDVVLATSESDEPDPGV